MEVSLFQKIYNPDVLSCIANLSNDEVFTPPEVANEIIDLLPQELFESPDTTFLDPCCKSGVFLREIAKRLIEGLKYKIPDLNKRIEHIFSRQLFGIAITELTSLLSRRSVYCSKFPSSEFSVYKFPDDKPQGNIIFQRIKHTWKNGKCIYCGAAQSEYDRDTQLETHAYQFIHNLDLERIFNMRFDVIIGNPPYQLSDGGGNGASARPIYQLFVEQAKRLNPRYLSMIIPARWFTGGKGLDKFRYDMLHDCRLRVLHDFPEATDCFSGVQIKGGVTFFLWDRGYSGDCAVYTHKDSRIFGPVNRPLLENGCDTFIRYNEAVEILHKVMIKKEKSMESLISTRLPFGIPNTEKGKKNKTLDTDLAIFVSGNDRDVRGTKAFIPLEKVTKGKEMIPWHKVYIAKAGSGSDTFPHPILPKPFYGAPNTICNESYLVIGQFKDENECNNVMSYIATKFFRFLVLLKKNSQNAPKGVYQFVPQQDFSVSWTDEKLYKKYNLTKEEIEFIESMIKPME